MPEKRGVKLQENERYSDKYAGLIEKGNGIFRKPYLYRGKPANRYFVETKCVCGAVVLAHLSNYKRYGSAVCSEECRKAIVSKPDGSVRRRKGTNKGSVLEKCANHPHAKKGYVHQHRLVVERDIGRFLSPEEVVHHINCVDTDNRLENLFVCSKKGHADAHNSLMDCVPYLLDNNIICFDKKIGRYVINGSSL